MQCLSRHQVTDSQDSMIQTLYVRPAGLPSADICKGIRDSRVSPAGRCEEGAQRMTQMRQEPLGVLKRWGESQGTSPSCLESNIELCSIHYCALAVL